MKTKINIFKQETNKSCGIACLRSIINHYGNNFSEQKIWDKHSSFKTKEGVRNPLISLGVTALKFGLKVKYIGYNPLFANENQFKDIKKSLAKKLKIYSDLERFSINQALEFIKKNGELEIRKLNLKDLKEIIRKEKFFLTEIKPAFISKNYPIEFNHKIIVSGYNSKGFYILNPSDQKEYLWDFKSFLMALYTSMPEILIIKK